MEKDSTNIEINIEIDVESFNVDLSELFPTFATFTSILFGSKIVIEE